MRIGIIRIDGYQVGTISLTEGALTPPQITFSRSEAEDFEGLGHPGHGDAPHAGAHAHSASLHHGGGEGNDHKLRLGHKKGSYPKTNNERLPDGAVSGTPEGVGGYNFMGSERARSMGMGDVEPGSPEAHLRFPTGIPEGEGPAYITANKYAGPDMAGFLRDLHEAGAPLSGFSGVYANREKRGGGGASQHAYGNAMDIESGFGSGPDNSPALYAWSQKNPDKFADIQAKHHMRNLDTSSGAHMHDWGHFEWTPESYAKNDHAPAATAAGAGATGGASPGISKAGPAFTGVASWYQPGVGFDGGGGQTSSGGAYSPTGFHGAINQSLRSAFGGVNQKNGHGWALVESPNGKSAIVKIDDVMGASMNRSNRVIDLNRDTEKFFGGGGLHPDMSVTPIKGYQGSGGPVTSEQATALKGGGAKSTPEKTADQDDGKL